MYKLFLQDGEFFGKSIDGSWNNIPLVPILKMEYSYTLNRKLILSGYKEYNHLVEKIAIIGHQGEVISKIFIMGRTDVNTDVFTIDLKTRLVSYKKVDIGQEYNGQVLRGWKEGLLNTPGWDDCKTIEESIKYKWDK